MLAAIVTSASAPDSGPTRPAGTARGAAGSFAGILSGLRGTDHQETSAVDSETGGRPQDTTAARGTRKAERAITTLTETALRVDAVGPGDENRSGADVGATVPPPVPPAVPVQPPPAAPQASAEAPMRNPALNVVLVMVCVPDAPARESQPRERR
ncbi:MAG: hypothetical protein ACK4QW_14725 [Alphaproteobacteria bacterium]